MTCKGGSRAAAAAVRLASSTAMPGGTSGTRISPQLPPPRARIGRRPSGGLRGSGRRGGNAPSSRLGRKGRQEARVGTSVAPGGPKPSRPIRRPAIGSTRHLGAGAPGLPDVQASTFNPWSKAKCATDRDLQAALRQGRRRHWPRKTRVQSPAATMTAPAWTSPCPVLTPVTRPPWRTSSSTTMPPLHGRHPPAARQPREGQSEERRSGLSAELRKNTSAGKARAKTRNAVPRPRRRREPSLSTPKAREGGEPRLHSSQSASSPGRDGEVAARDQSRPPRRSPH